METKRQILAAANLAEDLIIEILLRLPLNSIARFRCVCKSWYEILTHDINFANLKLNYDIKHENSELRLPKESVIYDTEFEYQLEALRSEDIDKIINSPFRYPGEGIQYLGCCNGLVCARRVGFYFYVWNSSTGEYKIISSPRSPAGILTNRHFVSDGDIGYGFGYDLETSDYKFVSVYSVPNTDVSMVEIYSLSSNTWKESSCIPYKLINGGEEPGVFINGALLWIENTVTANRSIILSYDMETEVFTEIPQPEHMGDAHFRAVDAFKGKLCLLCGVSDVSLEIWVMRHYGWSMLFKTKYRPHMVLFPKWRRYYNREKQQAVDKGTQKLKD